MSFTVDLDTCNYMLTLAVDKWSETFDLFGVPLATDKKVVVVQDVLKLM